MHGEQGPAWSFLGTRLSRPQVAATYVGGDGVLQRSEPFADDDVVFRLDQQLSALTRLQLQERATQTFTLWERNMWKSRGLRKHLYHVLLAGLVLGCPLHRASSQVHGELGFGLTAPKLDRRRNKALR